jgi:glycosyltransferase involved in cell wall biosynthesis
MPGKISIAFVANTSWSIYKFRLYLIEQLIAEGYSIYVLAPVDKYTAKFSNLPGLTYVELKRFKGKSLSPLQDLALYRELRRNYARIKPDLIFHYTIKANLFGSLAAARTGIRAISVVTGLGYTFAGKGWLQSTVKLLYKRALRQCAEVWFLNTDDLHFFTENKLVDATRTFVLPGEGVDTAEFFPAPFNPEKTTVTFMLIGRIISHKGIREFATAAAMLRQQKLNVRCQLLGFFDDNNPVAIPRREVEEWESRYLLTYLGHTDQVATYIEQADCIVLPSYREGMPLSLLEGASMCKALIATDTPGCRTLIEEGVNGYLCREKDGEDLARKMAAYYHLPAVAKREMGIAARNRVLRDFTRERITGIYLEKIKVLISSTY